MRCMTDQEHQESIDLATATLRARVAELEAEAGATLTAELKTERDRYREVLEKITAPPATGWVAYQHLDYCQIIATEALKG